MSRKSFAPPGLASPVYVNPGLTAGAILFRPSGPNPFTASKARDYRIRRQWLRDCNKDYVNIEVDTLHHQVVVGVVPRGRRGHGPGEFHYPARVAVLNNRAYVADSWNHRVQVFDLPNWKFAFEFGDFFCPKWIEVVHRYGKPLLLVVDTNNARICIHQPDGQRLAVWEFGSRRFPVSAQVLDSGDVEIRFENETTLILDIEDIVQAQWWTTKLEKPISIVRDARGLIYVSDFGRHVIEKFDADGAFIAQVLGPDVLKESGRMIMNGDDLVVTDRPTNAVFIYNTIDGTHRRWEHPFDSPGFLGQDSNGDIWIGTYTVEPNPNGALFAVFDSRYQFIRTVALPNSNQPTSIVFAGGRILVADQQARNVFVFTMDNVFMGMLREQPYDDAVWSIANDGAGHIYIGVAPVVDTLWAPDLNRLYYIDFENSAVRYSEACTPPSKP